MEKSIAKALWEETLYCGENGFYLKRFVPGRINHELREQINLGSGWETLAYIPIITTATVYKSDE